MCGKDDARTGKGHRYDTDRATRQVEKFRLGCHVSASNAYKCLKQLMGTAYEIVASASYIVLEKDLGIGYLVS